MNIELTALSALICWFIVTNEYTQALIQWAYDNTRFAPLEFILEHMACQKCLTLWVTLAVTWDPLAALTASFAAHVYDTQAVVVVVAFLYAWAAEFVGGVAAITGSYIAGVLFGQTPFKKRIDEGIHPLTYSILVPVFFMSIGLRANGRELGSQIELTVAIVVVAIVAKAVGCGLFARVLGFDTLSSVRVGLGMISRGEVGLIVAGYGLEHRIISQSVFSACVIMVLVTPMVTQPLLRLVFPRTPRHERPVVEETIAGPPEETEGLR